MSAANQDREKSHADNVRRVCEMIREALGVKVVPNVMKARENVTGADIKLNPYSIDVQRKARIGAIYEWLERAANNCTPSERPLVLCKADGKEWVAVLPMTELLRLIREEIDPYPWEVEQCH